MHNKHSKKTNWIILPQDAGWGLTEEGPWSSALGSGV